jgi:2-phospho-L-lactate guanylyltransferase
VTTVIIPAKSFARAKSRLHPVLDAPGRASFARSLFEHALDAVAACPRVQRVLVVTDGDDVEALAAARGLDCVRDRGEPPLSLAVDLALAHARARGPCRALVLMADLPRLTAADVTALVAGLDHGSVVTGPDVLRRGTNALGLAAGVSLPTAFGRIDSFRDHLAIAAERDLRVYVHESAGVAFDVDTPADLRAMGALSERPLVRTGSADRA